jgi:peroxiredoxin
MREGDVYPDLRLPEHTGEELALSEIATDEPLLLCFVRGWWCPKEQVRVRMLVSMQEELQREYGKIAVVTVDPPYVNGAFRAGIGADFPFLSDEERRSGPVEVTDRKHRPFLPMTYLLDSRRRVRRIWCGFWFWGNPTPEELRQGLREITREEQPTFEPERVWAEGAPPADTPVWIREDPDGNEIQRGFFRDGDLPSEGDELGESFGRKWVVHAVEGNEIHLRKRGPADTSPDVKHHITAPHA